MSTDTLATLIRTRREALGLKQGELATAVGTSPAYMSQIEKGRSNWPQNLIPSLSRVLGVSEVDLAIAAGLLSPDAATGGEHRFANPFERDDPRYQITEGLRRFDPTDEYESFALFSLAQLMRGLLDADRTTILPDVRNAWHAGSNHAE